ncbi:MAG: exo-alpha-sialidase [Planctomycetes bacterium]|nr:exo-alpha-sialidase [Planctomycetota bacterium]
MSDRLYVATRKGLFTLERGSGGAPWRICRTAFLGDQVTMVLPDTRDNHVYAAIGHGHFGTKLHVSADGGMNWEERTAPAYPEPPAGAPEDRCPVRQIPIPWRLEYIWALEAGGADQPGLVWCGTLPGGLFTSRDRGASWELVRPLWDRPERKKWFGGGMDYPGLHSIVVDPRDSRRVTVAVSCGGVWVTTDGGESWNCRADGMRAAYAPPEHAYDPAIQDPHRLVACPARPETMWVQHHNGVFRSTDGATSWHEITEVPPSTFGFAVAVHPRQPDTAWLVPAIKDERRIPVDGKVVVVRTRDGGRSFEVLTQGLPQEHAYDIVLRHCLDVDRSGDRLAFGSSTGSLWTSDDQGDSWRTVSSNLPPIYCVRFAR